MAYEKHDEEMRRQKAERDAAKKAEAEAKELAAKEGNGE